MDQTAIKPSSTLMVLQSQGSEVTRGMLATSQTLLVGSTFQHSDGCAGSGVQRSQEKLAIIVYDEAT